MTPNNKILMIETTPVVFPERLYRFEYVRGPFSVLSMLTLESLRQPLLMDIILPSYPFF